MVNNSPLSKLFVYFTDRAFCVPDVVCCCKQSFRSEQPFYFRPSKSSVVRNRPKMSSRTKRYLRRSRSKRIVRESRVGKAFQAEVPSILVKQEVESKLFDMERMLWNPNILPPETVQNYLKCVKAYGWKGLNEESALYLLHTSDYDTEEALKKFHLLPASAVHPSAWSAEECHHFDYGLAKHGKDFYRLQKTMLTRSTQEIVQYYYSWKKTERYDTFVQKVTQFENVRFRNKILKKMYRSTDFMDFFC